jgi:hypothetical protein
MQRLGCTGQGFSQTTAHLTLRAIWLDEGVDLLFWLQVRTLPGRLLADGRSCSFVGTDDLGLRSRRKRRQPICTLRFLILRQRGF